MANTIKLNFEKNFIIAIITSIFSISYVKNKSQPWSAFTPSYDETSGR